MVFGKMSPFRHLVRIDVSSGRLVNNKDLTNRLLKPQGLDSYSPLPEWFDDITLPEKEFNRIIFCHLMVPAYL